MDGFRSTGLSEHGSFWETSNTSTFTSVPSIVSHLAVKFARNFIRASDGSTSHCFYH